MTDLIAKAKRDISNKRLADEFVKHGKSLSPKQQEAFIAAAEFTALENASFDAFLLSPRLADYLREQVPTKAKDKKVAKVDRVEQAIVKTFRENPHLIQTLDQLDDVAREGLLGVLAKHITPNHGEEDQDVHAGKDKADNQATNPALSRLGDDIDFGRDVKQWSTPMVTDGGPADFMPSGSAAPLSIKLQPGEGSEALALALRLPSGLAAKIGNLGAAVNNFLNKKSGAVGKRVWAVATDIGDTAMTGTPIGRMVTMGRLIQQHGPGVLAHGLRNYYRFSGNERPIPEGLGSSGQGFEGSRNAVIAKLEAGLPSTQAAQNSRKYVPSEGYIVAPDGTIVARAIGRGGRLGDKPTDNYTPYTLNQLRHVKGNALIRRRMWGGPTEEDIRMGLLLGASEITTISNTGRYTIKLTGEGQGVNSELPLILNRLTELRGGTGSTKSSNHDNTVLALESLSAEFPIHFRQFTEDSGGTKKNTGESYEDGLPEEGFLTKLLGDWNKSFFGIGDDAPASKPSSTNQPDGNVPGSGRKREVGDKELRDKATGPANVVSPPDPNLVEVRTAKAIKEHNDENDVELDEYVDNDVRSEILDIAGPLVDDNYTDTFDERERTLDQFYNMGRRKAIEQYREDPEYFQGYLGITPSELREVLGD